MPAETTGDRRAREELLLLIRSDFRGIHVVSWEWKRVLGVLEQVAGVSEKSLGSGPPTKIYLWGFARGLTMHGTPESPLEDKGCAPYSEPIHAVTAAHALLKKAKPPSEKELAPGGIFVFCGIDAFWNSEAAAQNLGSVVGLTACVEEFVAKCRDRQAVFVSVGPEPLIPESLQKVIEVVDFPLPTREDLVPVVKRVASERAPDAKPLEGVHLDRVVTACQGLTLEEAANSLTLALSRLESRAGASLKAGQRQEGAEAERVARMAEWIQEQKAQVIKKSGILEHIRMGPGDVPEPGGLVNLRKWVESKAPFVRGAKVGDLRMPCPRGVLLIGVPGCGKSLMAKCIARDFGLPLLRMDVGRVFEKWVGSSEANMRSAIGIAEAAAPAVLWIDEVEKAFGGVTADGDHGSTLRVFGTFLTWMQERTASVFVVATCNNPERLPEEFKRRGRFDEIFFVDLPGPLALVQVFKYQVDWRFRKDKMPGESAQAQRAEPWVDPAIGWEALAKEAEGFSGADVEQAVVLAMESAYRRWVDEPSSSADSFRLMVGDLYEAVKGIRDHSTRERLSVDGRLQEMRNRGLAYALDAG